MYINFSIADKSQGPFCLEKSLELSLSVEEKDQTELVFLVIKMKYDFPTTDYNRLNENLYFLVKGPFVFPCNQVLREDISLERICIREAQS